MTSTAALSPQLRRLLADIAPGATVTRPHPQFVQVGLASGRTVTVWTTVSPAGSLVWDHATVSRGDHTLGEHSTMKSLRWSVA